MTRELSDSPLQEAKVLFILLLILPWLSHSSLAPPIEVPLNGSSVTATVLAVDRILPGSIQEVDTSLTTDRAVYAVKLKITTSTALHPGLETFIVPGRSYEAFTYHVVDAAYVGKTIAATLTLKGSTQRVRWWISNLRLGDKP
jgi:hypothetical protein